MYSSVIASIATNTARGHGARRILHLATRHQRALDAAEREDQNDRCARHVAHGWWRGDGEVRAIDEQHADEDEQQQAAAASRRSRCALSRLPCFTPRMLIVATIAKLATSSSAAHRPAARTPETACAAFVANTVLTAATAVVPSSQIENAGEKADVRTERELDVRVRPAGERDTTSGFSEAEHDQPHRDRAHDVGDRRGSTERVSDVGWKTEDAAADRDVDDAGRERPRTDRTNERSLAEATAGSVMRARKLSSVWSRH